MPWFLALMVLPIVLILILPSKLFLSLRHNIPMSFLFANIPKFSDPLSSIIHLPCIVDKREKVRFIDACDAP